MPRQGSWERKIWEDISDLIDEGSGGIKVEIVKDSAVDEGTEVSLDTLTKLRTVALLKDISLKLDKANFLLEQISGVDIDVENENGLN